jgi:hypothetical protein
MKKRIDGRATRIDIRNLNAGIHLIKFHSKEVVSAIKLLKK